MAGEQVRQRVLREPEEARGCPSHRGVGEWHLAEERNVAEDPTPALDAHQDAARPSPKGQLHLALAHDVGGVGGLAWGKDLLPCFHVEWLKNPRQLIQLGNGEWRKVRSAKVACDPRDVGRHAPVRPGVQRAQPSLPVHRPLHKGCWEVSTTGQLAHAAQVVAVTGNDPIGGGQSRTPVEETGAGRGGTSFCTYLVQTPTTPGGDSLLSTECRQIEFLLDHEYRGETEKEFLARLRIGSRSVTLVTHAPFGTEANHDE